MSKNLGEVERGEHDGGGGWKVHLPPPTPYFSNLITVLFPLHAFLETPAMQAY